MFVYAEASRAESKIHPFTETCRPSRLKILAKMELVTAIVDGQVLPFHLPSPHKPLSPPLIAMDDASAGYGGEPVLRRLSLSISDDDRIGLLGSNGNGKSTFAKLVSERLKAQGGSVRHSSKLTVGFFAQHQIDDLDLNDPLSMRRRVDAGDNRGKDQNQMRPTRFSECEGRYKGGTIVRR